MAFRSDYQRIGFLECAMLSTYSRRSIRQNIRVARYSPWTMPLQDFFALLHSWTEESYLHSDSKSTYKAPFAAVLQVRCLISNQPSVGSALQLIKDKG